MKNVNRNQLGVFVAGIVVLAMGSALLAPPIVDAVTASAGEPVHDAPSARSVASKWATGYVQSTIGPELGVGLDQMSLVDARYEPGVTGLVTSIDTGYYSSDPEDVWVLVWEREGVANVTTGQDDGTAVVVLVLQDGTGKVLSSSATVRQPDVQARARGPLPSFEEAFGGAIVLPDADVTAPANSGAE